MNTAHPTLFGLVTLALFVAPAAADDQPPATAKPLSEIVAILEDGQADVITEIDWDDDKWEIEARKDGKWTELKVNPATGAILSRSDTDAEKDVPPDDSLPLSQILRTVEQTHSARVTEAEFDDNRWEIELHDGSREIEVKINPRTGAAAGG